jgi:hypothetical protein
MCLGHMPFFIDKGALMHICIEKIVDFDNKILYNNVVSNQM